MKLRCELHCHSSYSPDCAVTPAQIIELCRKRNIGAIALTDHNEIAGALALQALAPENLTVIIGEEIATAQGDLIGLFLQKKIAARLDIQETISEIHRQGGLALLPHPFDRLRREAVGGLVTDQIKHQLDFIEVFNARCLFPADNQQALRFARLNQLDVFVGSDAHTAREYGQATCLVKPFKNAAEFAENLRAAEFTTRYASPMVHLHTKWVKQSKKQAP